MSILKDRLWESNDPYLKWLKENKRLSKTTIYHYYTYYTHFQRLKELNQQTIQSFIQKKKNNSIVRSFIRSFLEYATSKDLGIAFKMPPNPSGRKKQRIIKTYSQNQLNLVREGCYKRKFSYGLVFDLLDYGGLRRTEIQTININSFKWSNFFENTTKSCELIIEGKGKKHRPVLIPAKVILKMLEVFLEKDLLTSNMDKETLLKILSSNKNRLFNNIYEWKTWKIISSISKEKIGIAMRPHEIRHARATELQNKGASIRDIQHYLGHANPQITEIYLHTTQKTSLKNIRGIIDGK